MRNKEQRKIYMQNYQKEHKEELSVNNGTYYQKNKECLANYAREYRRRMREEVLTYYGGKCACCGESCIGFLTIDHVNGNGTKHRRSLKKWGVGFYVWLKRNDYPEGYQVLCFNCNCAKGYLGYCPHEGSK